MTSLNKKSGIQLNAGMLLFVFQWFELNTLKPSSYFMCRDSILETPKTKTHNTNCVAGSGSVVDKIFKLSRMKKQSNSNIITS